MYEYVCMNIDVMNMYEYVRMNIDVRVPPLIAGNLPAIMIWHKFLHLLLLTVAAFIFGLSEEYYNSPYGFCLSLSLCCLFGVFTDRVLSRSLCEMS